MAASKQVVGNPTPRVEGELKVSGKAKYAVDVTLPGMLWGKIYRSPIASAKIKKIDVSKAKALPGVHAVVTGEDCTGLRIGRRLYDMPILADGEVRFIGEKVAAVAADVEEGAGLALAVSADDDALASDLHRPEIARLGQLTGPRGAGLVLDCVGVQPTVDLGAKLLGRNCVWTIVGLGGGRAGVHA